MRLRWTNPAADDLENIKNYLQQNYPDFAEPTVRQSTSASAHQKPHRTRADLATGAARENWL